MSFINKYLINEIENYTKNSIYIILIGIKDIKTLNIEVLKKSISEYNSRLYIVKNNLLKIALQNQNIEIDKNLLTNSTAMLTGGNDYSLIAKSLLNFNKKNQNKLVIKCAIINNNILRNEQFIYLANLPDQNTIRNNLLFKMISPAYILKSVMMQVYNNLINILLIKKMNN